MFNSTTVRMSNFIKTVLCKRHINAFNMMSQSVMNINHILEVQGYS